MIKTTLLTLIACTFVIGCAASKKWPSKYDLPVSGVAHTKALGINQKFIFCTICPKPTLKTLAFSEDVEVVPSIQEPLRPLYVLAPSAIPCAVSVPVTTKFIVPFKFNSFKLGPHGKVEISKINAAFKLIELSNYEITIHGYTDDIGKKSYNKLLGWNRARTVYNNINKIILLQPFKVVTNGECCFIADNSNEFKRAPNRRAEVVLILKPKKGVVDDK